jgi:preprotein translocase subunit SecF
MTIEKMKYDIVGNRKYWFTLSILVTFIGLIFMVRNIVTDPTYHSPLRLGIDFTGGQILQLNFSAEDTDLSKLGSNSIFKIVDDVTDKAPQVQLSQLENETIVHIRADSSLSDPDKQKLLLDKMRTEFGNFTIEDQLSITPVISKELLSLALKGLFIGSILILIYVTIRMSFDFAVFAVIALVHDVLVLCGIFAMLQVEINSYFVAAALTIVGYSINDTIVIYDRIRENSKIYRSYPFDKVVNYSLLQTMARSINTILTTLFAIFAMYFFGGESIKDFMLALIIGITSGGYSSIFNASQLLVSYRKYKAKGRMIRAEESLPVSDLEHIADLDEADTMVIRQQTSTAARKKRKRRY